MRTSNVRRGALGGFLLATGLAGAGLTWWLVFYWWYAWAAFTGTASLMMLAAGATLLVRSLRASGTGPAAS